MPKWGKEAGSIETQNIATRSSNIGVHEEATGIPKHTSRQAQTLNQDVVAAAAEEDAIGGSVVALLLPLAPAPELDDSAALLLKSVYAGGSSMVSGSWLSPTSPPSSCWMKLTGRKEGGGIPVFRVPLEEGGTPPSSLAVVTDKREGARA
jgi:hypothetical protein